METSISWTSTVLPTGDLAPGFTFNPWWGCTRVSPACLHCYAARLDREQHWGKEARRRFQTPAYWEHPKKWNRKAEKLGHRLKVFCASMADVFEDLPLGHPDQPGVDQCRRELFQLIEETPWLWWLMLTKRPDNMIRMTDTWLQRLGRWPGNVVAMTTVEDQRRAEERIPHLLGVPAALHGLSVEPILDAVYLTQIRTQMGRLDALTGEVSTSFGGALRIDNRISWVVTGGESGPNARPSHPWWYERVHRDVRIANRTLPTWLHHKQWGEWLPGYYTTVERPQRMPGYYSADRTVIGGSRYFEMHTLDGHAWEQELMVSDTIAGRSVDPAWPECVPYHSFGDGVFTIRVGEKVSGRRVQQGERGAGVIHEFPYEPALEASDEAKTLQKAAA